MSTRSKQNAKWHKELRKWWTDNAMPQVCEMCGANWPLALAHSKKRRFILTREDYFETCCLCSSCHHFIEYGNKDEPGTHERMERLVKEIIARR